jgi:hypothetical protein
MLGLDIKGMFGSSPGMPNFGYQFLAYDFAALISHLWIGVKICWQERAVLGSPIIGAQPSNSKPRGCVNILVSLALTQNLTHPKGIYSAGR